MKGKLVLLGFAAALLLSGCGWSGRRMVWVSAHRQQQQEIQTEAVCAASYPELRKAMEDIISTGAETATILVPDYPTDFLDIGMERACEYVQEEYPIGAYAVNKLSYEIGTSMGKSAVAVSIGYRHGWAEIQRIRSASSEEEARSIITDALERFDAGVVMLQDEYMMLDCTQLVQDFAREYPQVMMELPQVTQSVYGRGAQRVVELIFTYQTDRESLRRMQAQVKPMFDAAPVYVSEDGEPRQKFAQLYAFLMERFDYKVETSITPTYSLLRHGVGDSRAFATVYAAMCRAAGLECLVVSGTHSGEPWVWNIVGDGENYFHVDLLRCSAAGDYRELTGTEMAEYVWDYSSFPQSQGAPEPRDAWTEPLEKAERADQEETEESELPSDPLPNPEEETEPAWAEPIGTEPVREESGENTAWQADSLDG